MALRRGKTPDQEAPLEQELEAGAPALPVAIAAGGTGGHIMPALALAEALTNIGESVQVDFFCGSRDVELDIYRQAGVEPRVFPLRSMSASGGMQRAMQAAGLGYSFLRSLAMVRRYKVVVGMGGYISGPVLSAARSARVPFLLHEANTVLGKVNRMMASRAEMLALGMPLVETPEELPPERIVELGTPVRRQIPRGERAEAARAMHLEPEAFTVLVLGGSQGARGMNELLAGMFGRLAPLWPQDRPFQVVWAAGPDNLPLLREALRDKPLRGRMFLAPSIDRMEQAYAAADLVISRAGASTLAELLVCRLPSILLPLPGSAEDHQKHNAEVLLRKGAALVFDQETVAPDTLARELLALATDAPRLGEMAEQARRLACPDAARDLARLVVEVATGRRERAGRPD